MPTPTPAYRLCILLAASTEWKTLKTWTDLIGFSDNPFEGDHSTFPELNSHFPQVKTFVLSLTSRTTEKDKYDFFRKRQGDNHTHGRKAVTAFVTSLLKTTKIVRLVETHIKETHDWSSASLLSRFASECEMVEDVTVCNSIRHSNSGLTMRFMQFPPMMETMRDYNDVVASSAVFLYGKKCLGMGGMPKSPYGPLISTILSRWWDKQKQTLGRNVAKIKTLRIEEKAAEDCALSESEALILTDLF